MVERRLEVRSEIYRDSITMLRVSNELAKLDGVSQAAAVMATQLNKKLLRDIGFTGANVDSAKSDDMIIAIEATTKKLLEQAFSKADELILAKPSTSSVGNALPNTLDAAVSEMENANMVLISIPGRYAKSETLNAINKGLNVFLFSSNVSIEDELELKKRAISSHLLMMGPDCGTSIINDTILGFGNVLRPGPVGIVSAASTGLQQVSTLLDRQGIGISQGIGTGGNDLSDEVGGLMMIEGMRLLNDDPQTKIIVLISKPPGQKTEERVLEEASKCNKPVVINFLGSGKIESRIGNNCVATRTLEEAAKLASEKLASNGPWIGGNFDSEENQKAVAREWNRLAPLQKYIRGLYSGGTLCYEAQMIMIPFIGEIRSNAPLNKTGRIEGESDISGHHICIDMGAEEYVVGRAHPMIDYTLRKLRILKEAKDPETAVILLDIVLGYGSNPDPSAELIPAIIQAKKLADDDGRYLSVVASLVGTKNDPQQLDYQEKRLREAGVLLLSSNAQAALAAAQIANRGKKERLIKK